VLAVSGIVYPFVLTWIILWITDKTVGLRVSAEDEQAGLDLSEHGEPGYEVPTAAAVAMVGNGSAASDGTV
jgi:ammonium transporter, Amt family